MKPYLAVDNTEPEIEPEEKPKKKCSICRQVWNGFAWLGVFTATMIAYTIYQGVGT